MAGSKGLGRGLGTLFGDEAELTNDFEYVPLSKVEPRKDQPRSNFSEPELNELAESIREHGVLQPLTVRALSGGFYQIIAGERRWRAARLAGIDKVPVRIVTADDKRATELAMVENLQREGLDPIEEARGYRTLMEEYGLTQEQVAQKVSKSRPVIANALRLLALPLPVIKMLEDGDLSAGHARALVSLDDDLTIVKAAERVVKDGLNVRETEALAKRIMKEKLKAALPEEPTIKVDYLGQVADQLTNTLGRRVKIAGGKKKGRITIEYYDQDDFEALYRALDSISVRREGK
ncbi:MAG: ParB/RepB/Spo0J family partition protein [Oscillospiraceae bacterium]|nr:ParB/RepB/Spo0J family partition protein [Oscillospiraceae bacterium]